MIVTRAEGLSKPKRLLALGSFAALALTAAVSMPSSAQLQQTEPTRLTPQKLVPPSAVQPAPAPPLPDSVQELLAPRTPAGVEASPITRPPTEQLPAKDPAAPGIQVDSLRGIDPDTAGTLTEAQGGFGLGMWRGTPRRTVERLVPLLPVGTTSATMRDLMRRLLLSTAEVPDGEASGPGLVVLRVKALAAMGDLVAVNSLLNAIPGHTQANELIRVETDARFLANDNARACPLVAGQIRETDALYWQKAFAFCQALAGERDKAALGVSLLREVGEGDEVFFHLFDGLISGEAPTIDNLPDPTPLHLAMARVAKAQLPIDVISSSRPGVLRNVAVSPNASKGLRLEAAELAEAAGVLPIDALRQLYTSLQFSEADLANPLSRAEVEFGPTIRALLYHTSLIQTVPTAQAEALARAFALARDEGRYASAVRVFMPVLKRIPPSAELLWFAPEAARAFMLTEDQTGVTTWFQLMRAAALFNPDAKTALNSLKPIAHLTGSVEAEEWTDESLAAWRAAIAGKETADADAVLLYYLFEGLGEPVAETAWDDLLKGAARHRLTLPEPGLWRRLVRLTEHGWPSAAPPASPPPDNDYILEQQPPAPTTADAATAPPAAESVLISLLALGDGGPTRADPLLLRQVLLTLRAVGLEHEARRLAAEAALAAGL